MVRHSVETVSRFARFARLFMQVAGDVKRPRPNIRAQWHSAPNNSDEFDAPIMAVGRARSDDVRGQ